MRNVGIVRRLDALGRIVIPREYRKLHRIELGDPLEIIAMDSGEIVLRKVDLTAELINFGQMVSEAAASELSKTVLISTHKTFVTGHGSGKNAFIGQDLSGAIAKSIVARREICGTTQELGMPTEFAFAVACPIMGDMDVFGAVVLLSNDSIIEAEIRMAKTLAIIIGNNLQKY